MRENERVHVGTRFLARPGCQNHTPFASSFPHSRLPPYCALLRSLPLGSPDHLQVSRPPPAVRNTTIDDRESRVRVSQRHHSMSAPATAFTGSGYGGPLRA
jgi:hypothetical protein